jgi:tRNA nucleotidyltransferase (CCA-adding enzyme)
LRRVKSYLVGGAVRDRLLGLAPAERDWVVVGGTEAAMLAAGYRRVGHDFPVFLHPGTNEQYALARRERKQGHGHTGFVFDAGPEVSLEDDLLRRDLTINAMAEDASGALIDPHGGHADLCAGVLRHVSSAFVEDPLRVLRVARFAARFALRGFRVAPETLALMREITASGELAHLAAERVFAEIRLALDTARPEVFVRVLRECGALAALLPEVERLFGVPQPAKYHPEIDTGEHLLLALGMSARLGLPPEARFAVLLHDLGKGLTPPAQWPSHIGHDGKPGVEAIETVCARLKAPRRWRELALAVCRLHQRSHRAPEMRAPALLRLLEAADALRQPERFELILGSCEADARGRAGLQDQPYPQAALLRQVRAAAATVNPEEAMARGLTGERLGAELRRLRCRAVAAALAAAQQPA